jgi:choline dehydrogenase-like flavoprotein
MDHHKHVGASAAVEGFEDQYYYGRRPNGVYVPRFRNITDKRPDYVRGFGYQGGASRTGWNHVLGSALGSALKEAAQTPGPWRIGFGGFGECLPYPENRVTLNTDQKDKWGRPTVAVDAEFKENERAMHNDISAAMGDMLETLGYKNVNTYTNQSFPGNANHEMGTARMGRDPRTSVLNAFNQMHEVKNVFITDGSAMTSSSCVNPSLTYMALTARACDYAVKELNRLNL